MVESLLSDVKNSRAYQEFAEEISQELKSKIAQEKAREIAKALLRKKMSLDFNIEVTGLSKKDVRAISKELASRRN
ncbi:MAG: SDH family Clp fold serine proteinase [bacterium]